MSSWFDGLLGPVLVVAGAATLGVVLLRLFPIIHRARAARDTRRWLDAARHAVARSEADGDLDAAGHEIPRRDRAAAPQAAATGPKPRDSGDDLWAR